MLIFSIIGIVTIIIGLISTYVDNNRATVEGAVETVKTWKWVQYALTFLVMVAPFIEMYKPDILNSIPDELKPIAAVFIAMILIFAAGQREKISVTTEGV